MSEEKWSIKAAREIDALLSDAVRHNTNEDYGFFSGVSIKDISIIIEKHLPQSAIDFVERNQ